MNKLIVRDCLKVFAVIILGGIVIGNIARYYRNAVPNYATNITQPCTIQTVILPYNTPIHTKPHTNVEPINK
jgi:hypothetical protein